MAIVKKYDAVIVGAGPNGLAAAITLARAGCSVLVIEGAATIGGGTRTKALTLPGFQHDVCSAIHPLALGSPFFKTLPLTEYGLEWLQPPVSVAHPLEDGRAAALYQSLETTVQHLGEDGQAYYKLMSPLVRDWDKLAEAFLAPLRLPRHPLVMANFGLKALRSAKKLATSYFKSDLAQALLAGTSAHSFLPLEQPPSAAFGLMLNIVGHAVGWAIPKGGSQRITETMAAYLRTLGGEIITDWPVKSLAELPEATAVLLDVTPRQLLQIAGDKLPKLYTKQLQAYRYGPGVFKIDYALDGAVPWLAEECRQAGTVHVGGTFAEVAAAERTVSQGQHPTKPFVLVAQQSLFDTSRAPAGQHTLWAYCHVPNGSTVDMTAAIEAQIERFAPGFKARILARHVMNTPTIEQYNPNYIGGDINGGIQDFWQLFTRPVIRLNPYTTPVKGLYLCSSSTPPGGGVHGMCGYWAAQAALKRL